MVAISVYANCGPQSLERLRIVPLARGIDD
jgi:hypothetical protein